MFSHLCSKVSVELQAGHLHLSDPGRLEAMMEYLDYGAPDVTSLGCVVESESPW